MKNEKTGTYLDSFHFLLFSSKYVSLITWWIIDPTRHAPSDEKALCKAWPNPRLSIWYPLI